MSMSPQNDKLVPREEIQKIVREEISKHQHFGTDAPILLNHVLKLLAGTGITLSPTDGKGKVTVTASQDLKTYISSGTVNTETQDVTHTTNFTASLIVLFAQWSSTTEANVNFSIGFATATDNRRCIYSCVDSATPEVQRAVISTGIAEITRDDTTREWKVDVTAIGSTSFTTTWTLTGTAFPVDYIVFALGYQ